MYDDDQLMRDPIQPTPANVAWASASPSPSLFGASASYAYASASPPQSPFGAATSYASIAPPSPSPWHQTSSSSWHQSSSSHSALEQAAYNQLVATARASKKFRMKTPITNNKDLYVEFMHEMTQYTSFTTRFTDSRSIDLSKDKNDHMKAICAA